MESIKEIETQFKNAAISELDVLIEKYCSDERTGVQKLIAKAIRTKEKLEAERVRIDRMREFEKIYASYDNIGGVDEVGRGPLAGPVVTACVILPKDCEILYVNDSKQLSEKKREELYPIIMENAVSVGIGIQTPEEIDEKNILQATFEAMRQGISKMDIKPEILLNDAVTIPDLAIKQVPIIKGDAKSLTIACASIIAKVTRDHMMVEYDKLYPEYGFASNKGYGSAVHIEALKKYGPCPIHRKTFIRNFI